MPGRELECHRIGQSFPLVAVLRLYYLISGHCDYCESSWFPELSRWCTQTDHLAGGQRKVSNKKGLFLGKTGPFVRLEGLEPPAFWSAIKGQFLLGVFPVQRV